MHQKTSPETTFSEPELVRVESKTRKRRTDHADPVPLPDGNHVSSPQAVGAKLAQANPNLAVKVFRPQIKQLESQLQQVTVSLFDTSYYISTTDQICIYGSVLEATAVSKVTSAGLAS